MPRRGAWRAWQRLPNETVASLKEARALMKCFDLGAGGLWKWPSSGGGDGVTVSCLQCNAHVECGVRVRTVRQSSGCYAFESSGEHSSEVSERQRKNAPLTHKQTAFANASFLGTGATPAEVRVGLTKTKEAELQKIGIDPVTTKDAEGGLAGAPPGAVLLCAWCLRCRDVLPRPCRRITTYSYCLTVVLLCIAIGNVL